MSNTRNSVNPCPDIDVLALDFDVAQATAKSITSLLWNIDDGVQEVDINDVGRSCFDAVQRMERSFRALLNYTLDEEGRKVREGRS